MNGPDDEWSHSKGQVCSQAMFIIGQIQLGQSPDEVCQAASIHALHAISMVVKEGQVATKELGANATCKATVQGNSASVPKAISR
jgi:hypothetical protein